jgi:branched-subunit amino acid aminotransferase/4-amino-4-deoxychorismate lyase
LNTIEEAFITSTSRAVLPVVQIGDVIIGEGKPGQITTFLGKNFNERMMTEAEFV